MDIIDDRTLALDLPLPHPDNDLSQDVTRLRAALVALDNIVAEKANGADIQAALTALVGVAPSALDTLAELAAALGDDPNFSTTIMDLIGSKAEGSHGHEVDDIGGLSTYLDNMADVLESVAGKADTSGATFTGPILFDGEHDNGNSGTAKTIDFGIAQNHRLTLNGNCVLTFTAPPGVFAGRLRVIKDATASARSITWPTGTRFLANVTPQAPDAISGAVSMYFVYFDGATWWVSGGRF